MLLDYKFVGFYIQACLLINKKKWLTFSTKQISIYKPCSRNNNGKQNGFLALSLEKYFVPKINMQRSTYLTIYN